MLIAWTADVAALQLSEIEHLLSIGVDAMVVATSGDDTACFQLLKERHVSFSAPGSQSARGQGAVCGDGRSGNGKAGHSI